MDNVSAILIDRQCLPLCLFDSSVTDHFKDDQDRIWGLIDHTESRSRVIFYILDQDFMDDGLD